MKRLSVILLLIVSYFSQAQIINFPDINFKNALLNHNPVIDTNNDGEIQVSEAIATTGVVVTNKNISDLTGIEYFENINYLYCDGNNLTTFDYSLNRNIYGLYCGRNNLTTLDVSNYTELINLYCELNSLRFLNAPTNLSYLFCQYNNLTSLNVPPNVFELRCNNNNLSTIDVSNNTTLAMFFCAENPNLSNVNLNGCTGLNQFNSEYNTNLTNLDLSNTPYMISLEITQCGLTSLDVTNLPFLLFLYCGDNQIPEINLSNNQYLRWLGVSWNNLKELDVSNNTYLEFLWCHDNQLNSLDVRNGNNTNIYNFSSSHNPDLTCIYVDDVEYFETNWGDYIDPNSTFVSNEVECNTLVINDFSLNTISIYPNPVKEVLHINTRANISQYIIIDINGKTIAKNGVTTNNNSTLNIDVSSLTKGAYFVKLIADDGKFIIKKIIKE